MASASATGSPHLEAPRGVDMMSASAIRRRARARAKFAADRLITKLRARLLRAGLAPSAHSDPTDAEVARRQSIARPAFRARVAGDPRSGPAVLRRNVAEHAAFCPEENSNLAAFRSAQRAKRLGGPSTSLPRDAVIWSSAGPLSLPPGSNYWLCQELDNALANAAAESLSIAARRTLPPPTGCPAPLPLTRISRPSDATVAWHSLGNSAVAWLEPVAGHTLSSLYPSHSGAPEVAWPMPPPAVDGTLAPGAWDEVGDNLATPVAEASHAVVAAAAVDTVMAPCMPSSLADASSSTAFGSAASFGSALVGLPCSLTFNLGLSSAPATLISAISGQDPVPAVLSKEAIEGGDNPRSNPIVVIHSSAHPGLRSSLGFYFGLSSAPATLISMISRQDPEPAVLSSSRRLPVDPTSLTTAPTSSTSSTSSLVVATVVQGPTPVRSGRCQQPPSVSRRHLVLCTAIGLFFRVVLYGARFLWNLAAAFLGKTKGGANPATPSRGFYAHARRRVYFPASRRGRVVVAVLSAVGLAVLVVTTRHLALASIETGTALVQQAPWPDTAPHGAPSLSALRTTWAHVRPRTTLTWHYGVTNLARVPPHLHEFRAWQASGVEPPALVPLPEDDFPDDRLWAAKLSWSEDGLQFAGIIIAVLCNVDSWGRVYAIEVGDVSSSPDDWEFFTSEELHSMVSEGQATLTPLRGLPLYYR